MIYLIGRLFVSTSSQFVAVFLLSAVDFYTTKNFSGRYLIGVRWWSVDGGDTVLNSMRFEVSNVSRSARPISSVETRAIYQGGLALLLDHPLHYAHCLVGCTHRS